MVVDPHVRLVPPSAENTAVFMTLQNHGEQERKLVKAESPAAKVVELHTVIREGDVMKMRPVPDIPVKSHGETVLKPGSYHVMLIGLVKPLNEGDTVPLTLSFDDGSKQELKPPVRVIQPAMKMK
jgi:copper(I)-binding protein